MADIERGDAVMLGQPAPIRPIARLPRPGFDIGFGLRAFDGEDLRGEARALAQRATFLASRGAFARRP